MSDLSKIKNAFMSFSGKLGGGIDPSVQPTVEAGAFVSTAVPTLASAGTKSVPAEFTPFAAMAVQLGVAELTSRLQSVSKPATA